MQYSAVSCKIAHRTLLAVLLSFILLVCSVHAQTIAGKVVGVSDGHTITVLQARTHTRSGFTVSTARRRGRTLVTGPNSLHPEWYVGRQARVVQMDMDRYGWLVGTHCFIIVSKTSWLMYDLKNLYCFCKKINATSFRS
jgi:hypothetical protein